MVILGGLEIVVGGYLVHRYHKSKNEKKKLQEEANQRRHNTFPGARPQTCNPYSPEYPPPQHPPPNRIPQQKYACYAPQQPQQAPAPQYQAQPYPYAPQPGPQVHTIQRRPVPPPAPQIIQPLQRADSFATISRMPIANGSRPSDMVDDMPNLPPRRQTASNLSPIPQSPYSNASFSHSTPAMAPAPAGHPSSPHVGRHTVDDNWETYSPQTGLGPEHYAPSVSTQLGEDDPPPPYRP